MRAGELCVRDVVTAHPEETAVEAARRMAALHVGDLIVVDERAGTLPRPIGIITDRDLVVDVLARPERVAAETRISQLVRGPLITAHEDDDIEGVVEKMREHAIRRIPVVDRDGGLQGVISIDDVIGWMRDQLQAATRLLEYQGLGPQLAHALAHGGAPTGIK